MGWKDFSDMPPEVLEAFLQALDRAARRPLPRRKRPTPHPTNPEGGNG